MDTVDCNPTAIPPEDSVKKRLPYLNIEEKTSSEDEKTPEASESEDELAAMADDFFEGREKLLKVWFADESYSKTPKSLTSNSPAVKSLRSIPVAKWEVMLDLVACKIISTSSNASFDAYVLSESSFFVWDRKIVLKTCGTTTLLYALPMLFELACSVGLSVMVDLLYSRRNWMNPHQQEECHRDFSAETNYLDKIVHGSAYVIGNVNSEHWNLYVTDKPTFLSVGLGEKGGHLEPSKPYFHKTETTWELHMTGLNPRAMQIFYMDTDYVSAQDTSDRAGISQLIPGMVVDSFVFDPQGYSMNGLIDEHYVTIHVTPQESCSYASFETNYPGNFMEIAANALSIFQPSEFTLSVTRSAHQFVLDEELPNLPRNFQGFQRVNKFLGEFENMCEITFAHFSAGSSLMYGGQPSR